MILVIAPSKYGEFSPKTRSDLPINDPHSNVDELMFYMNRLGINTLDLNQYLPCDEMPFEKTFYKTDHHWTVEASLYSSKIIVEQLNDKFGYGLDTDYYLNPENFRTVTYYHGMLGSMGRGAGACFSGVDDFTAYYPKWKNDYVIQFMDEEGGITERSGDTVGSLIMPEILFQKDLYAESQFDIYLNGMREYEHIDNVTNPDGLKLLTIRDSYFSPVLTFLAPFFGEIDSIWSMENNENIDIETYIRDNKFDCIIIEYYPYNIKDEGFQFFMDEE